MDVLEIRLLGPFRIISEQRGDITPKGRRAHALVAMVALAERKERSRSWLAAKLWSESGPAQSSASLRQELRRLRAHLPHENFVTLGDRVRLVDVRVDVAEIAARGRMPADFVGGEVPDLLEGLEVNDEEFEDWLRAQRQYWSERIEAVLEKSLSERARAPQAMATSALIAEGRELRVPDARGGQPALGLLPCIIMTANPVLHTIGDLLCDLAGRRFLNSGSFRVFDFRDPGGRFGFDEAPAGIAARGPDLLLTLRLMEIADILEISIGLRRITDAQFIWTHTFGCDPEEVLDFQGGRVGEELDLAVGVASDWLAGLAESDPHVAARLKLAAAHSILSLMHGRFRHAERSLATAFEMQPSVSGLGWLAILEIVRLCEGDARDRTESAERVRALTARTLELDGGNARVLALLGHANAVVSRDFDMAGALIADALRLGPHRAACWDAHAMFSIYNGDMASGYASAKRAKALGRFSPYSFWYDASCGIAEVLATRGASGELPEPAWSDRAMFQPTLRLLAVNDQLKARTAEVVTMYSRLGKLPREQRELSRPLAGAALREAAPGGRRGVRWWGAGPG